MRLGHTKVFVWSMGNQFLSATDGLGLKVCSLVGSGLLNPVNLHVGSTFLGCFLFLLIPNET